MKTDTSLVASSLLGVLLLSLHLTDDLVRGTLSPRQRVARHLWRMCFAFFIATGSFFLGQQDVMPQAVRGSPILFVLAFAPFAIMIFWLVRIRMANMATRLTLRRRAAIPVPATPTDLAMEV